MNRLFALLFVLFLAVPALAGPQKWSAEVGIGGSVAPGTWAPLWLEAPADAGEWTLEVRFTSVSGRESGPVTTLHASGGRYEEPLFLADSTRKLHLRFLTQGIVREELTLLLEARSFPGHLIGVEGLSPSVRSALTEVLLPHEPVRVVTAPGESWPSSPLAWGNLAALVVKDPGPILSPAQVSSLRAWISSGGRLVVVESRPGKRSLLAQVGSVPGWGKALGVEISADPEFWRRTLELQPFGQLPRLGTDFGPSATNLPSVGQPNSLAALVLVLVWAALAVLVPVVFRKGSVGWPLAGAFLGSVAVMALWFSGSLAWDKGLPLHGREMVLPGDLGRFTSLEVGLPDQKPNSLGWTDTSPWALGLWKAQAHEAAWVRVETTDRVVQEAFRPALDRQSEFRISGSASLRWSQKSNGVWSFRELAPAAFESDLAWLTRWAQAYPDTTWSVGIDGTTCWLRPEPSEGAL